MGCAVACVASYCGTDYPAALRLFETDRHAWTRGFYCVEVVEALAKIGQRYTYEAFRSPKHIKILHTPGSILFLAPSERYPSGHYVLRVENGWMNPWVNFPQMNPVRAAEVSDLEGEVAYVVFPESLSEK